MESKTPDDYMRWCVALAKLSIKRGNPPFGALLVLINNDVLTAEAKDAFLGDAEIGVVEQVIKWNVSNVNLSQATLYTLTDPSPVACTAIDKLNINKVVIGYKNKNYDCNKIFDKLQSNVKVCGPTLSQEIEQFLDEYNSKDTTTIDKKFMDKCKYSGASILVQNNKEIYWAHKDNILETTNFMDTQILNLLKKLPNRNLQDMTLYTHDLPTELESYALLGTKLSRIVYGINKPNKLSCFEILGQEISIDGPFFIN